MKQDNSIKQLNFTTVVNETKKIPKLEVSVNRNGKYMKYGEDNLFPQYLWELFTNSSQFSAIVNNMVDYIQGNGVETDYPLVVVNRKGETFENLIERIVYDYLIFGGFAVQVIRNRGGEVCEIHWLDFRYIRTNYDEDTIYYNEQWGNSRVTPKVYDRYVKGSRQQNSVYYYKGRLTRNQYPIPSYISALTAIEISTQIPEYHLNNLTNGFHPSAVINFNNGSMSEDVMDEIEEKIEEKFSGTQNASRILLSFNDNTEHATTIERLADEGNVDIYNTLAQSVEKDIYTAFRCNKLLMGDGSESTGFNKATYVEAFAIYNKTVIQPIQRELEEAVGGFLEGHKIKFNRFVVDWSETGPDEDTSKIIE